MTAHLGRAGGDMQIVQFWPGAAALFATQHAIGDPVAGSFPPPIRAVVDTAVKTGNGKLSRVEQVKRFAVLPAF